MKPSITICALVISTVVPLFLGSCSSMPGFAKLAGVNVDSLPGVNDLTAAQDKLTAKHSKATTHVAGVSATGFERPRKPRRCC